MKNACVMCDSVFIRMILVDKLSMVKLELAQIHAMLHGRCYKYINFITILCMWYSRMDSTEVVYDNGCFGPNNQMLSTEPQNRA